MKKSKVNTQSSHKTAYISCFFIMLIFSVLLPVALKINTEVHYKYVSSGINVGDIAEKDVYAKSSIELIDIDATNLKKEEARDSIYPVFSYSQVRSSQILSKSDKLRNSIINNDYNELVNLIGEQIADEVIKSADPKVFAITYNIITDIIAQGYYDANDLNLVQDMGYDIITVSNMFTSSIDGYESNIVLADTNLITTSNIDKYIIAKLASDAAGLNVKEISLVEILVSSLIAPNILYDEPLTLQRKDAAENAVDTVVVAIEKGDLLIEDKHVITHEQKRILGLLSSQSNNFSIIETLGFVIFDTFIIGVGLNVFGFFMGRKNLHYVEYLVLLTVGLVISIIATYFLTIVSSRLNIQFTDSFIPLFFLPLFVTELSGKKRLGFVALFIYSSIIATLPNANIMSFFYCLTCGAASILLVRFFNRRIDVVYHWFFSCITCSGLSFTYMIIEQVTFNSIFTVLLGTILNVSISSILLSLSIPVVEKVFNLPTIFRLYELAYGENPILTRLSQAAPGTYSHSLAVADLAEAGARAIGANPLLARVGGLYHDIGKIEHPEYFIENQSGFNKHDEISPSLSVAVIKSHVKVGADKGREVGLPLEIIKVISSHHGNDVIQYFYHEALKSQAASNDNNDPVKASDFAYNAAIPDFKECGIVMLADSIEAASRTVTPNATKYAKLIESIFLGKIERSQLNDSNLTMNDIRTLADSFVKSLVARNHSRIEYPDED